MVLTSSTIKDPGWVWLPGWENPKVGKACHVLLPKRLLLRGSFAPVSLFISLEKALTVFVAGDHVG
jgi:hypothetical protein